MGFEAELFPDDETLIRQVLDGGPTLQGITLERLKAEGFVRLNLPEVFIPFAEGVFPTPTGKCELYSERMKADGLDPLASVRCPIGQSGTPPNCVTTATNPPRPGGYFKLLPVGSFSSLPTDAKAAQMVHYSTWEPRPQNSTADKAIPPSSFQTAGYSGMENHAEVFGRVDGNFTGTTDEIIQWAAAKWGLPDDLMRAQAVVETGWYQDNKDAHGNPIPGEGYGDFGGCGGSPPPSGYGVNGPSSFGIMQDRWCAMKDPGAPGYDGWPWSENSTAYNLDVYGAVMRGCYEGWDTWLGGKYKAGNLWGCVGKWFSGTWFTGGARTYIADVKAVDQSKSWRGWPSST